MVDIGWGSIAKFEKYGRAGDHKDDFDVISYTDAKSARFANYMHASHAMIFARRDDMLWDLYEARGAVLVSLGIWRVNFIIVK